MNWKYFFLLICTNLIRIESREYLVQQNLDLALQYFQENKLQDSIRLLRLALHQDPYDVDVNGVLGSIYILDSNVVDGVRYLQRSMDSGGITNSENVANLLHGLLMLGDLSRGLSLFEEAISFYPSNLRIIFNGLLIYYSLGQFERMQECVTLYLKDATESWVDLMSRMTEKKYFDIAEYLGRLYLERYGEYADILFQLALSLHFQNKLHEALEMYQRTIDLQPNNSIAITNIGALYQAIGHNDEAHHYYRKSFNQMSDDAGLLNNFGILLLHSSKEEEIAEGVVMLERALEINPNLENAVVNLASYYLDEGRLLESESLYKRVLNSSDSRKMIEIRLATLMSPVVGSWSQMVAERNNMIMKLHTLLIAGRPSDSLYRELDPIMDRIHFYIVYSGLNDRHIQESISTIYSLLIRNISKVSRHLPQTSNLYFAPKVMNSRVRVGFLSKYFGVYEPHGLLLEGVMGYLPRSMFEVITITNRPNQGKYLSPVVSKYSDRVVFIPMIHDLAFQQIADMKLDILIFADTLSESLTHFLAQTRLAPLQIAFWGNPVTSGSKTIDYFISSEFMEHPYRTRLLDDDEPYVEQVVLLPGQAIWYSSPNSASSREVVQYLNLTMDPHEESFERKDFGLDDKWFIFFCPQSLFKIHPLFDHVLASILEQSPQSHLVLITGRKKRWTSIFLNRISQKLEPNFSRCHIIERITSQKFFGLIKLADVLLHPFPFDGSRTSADSLSVGVPFVTLPSEYLRGRMGASFLRTMNIPELVAHNVSEYIQISVRLSIDRSFYLYIKSLIQTRSWLIWDDMLCPYSWTTFLALSSGLQPPSWEEYIVSFNLSLAKETKYRSIREINQQTFDLRWGKELWLLGERGFPRLPDQVHENESLPIFNNWQQIPMQNSEPKISEKSHLIQIAYDYALAGNFTAAFEIESLTLRDSDDDPKIYLELGIYQYFRGYYQSAIQFCEESARLLHIQGRESSQVYGCIGVSATYVDDQERAVTYLNKALDAHNTPNLSPIFSFPRESIEKSLATGLKTFKRYAECVNFLSSIFNFPLLSKSGSFILFLSFYEISAIILDLIGRARSILVEEDMEAALDVVAQTHRLQQEFNDFIEIARDCLLGLLKSDIHRYRNIKLAFDDVTEILHHANLKISNYNDSRRSNFDEKIILVTQYYVPSSMLTHDIDSTLLKNLANPFISDVYLLNEKFYQLEKFPFQSKLHQIVIGRRPTFQDFFQYANVHLQNKLILIANSDIYFDESLGMFLSDIKNISFHKTVLALSKWVDWIVESDFISLFPRVESQDAWLFKTPISEDVIDSSAFYLGTPRCDNRLASIFNTSGYRIFNPIFQLHAIELSSNVRNSGLYEMAGSPLGKTRNVFITIDFPIHQNYSNL